MNYFRIDTGDITDEDLRREREEAQELARNRSPHQRRLAKERFAMQITRSEFGARRRR